MQINELAQGLLAKFKQSRIVFWYDAEQSFTEELEQLTNSIYTTRIPAGIADKNIKVAHKIGTNFNNNQNDCGIIYYPKNNYLLCVMIPGNESEQTDQHIANISKIVYDFINTGK